MKLMLLFLLLLMSTLTFGQRTFKLLEYEAINGINYKIGDSVQLNKGSDYTGNFLNVIKQGDEKSSKIVTNFPFIITQITQINYDFGNIYEFRGKIGASKDNEYYILIDSAIETKEINF